MKPTDLFRDLFSVPADDSVLVYDDEDLERFGNKMLAAMLLTVAFVGLCVFIYPTVLR